MDLDQRSLLDDVWCACWDHLDRFWSGYLLPCSCVHHRVLCRYHRGTRSRWLERRGIDDAVGAVTVHGTIGLYGVVMLGVFRIGLSRAAR